jgi:reductive dehalogenase
MSKKDKIKNPKEEYSGISRRDFVKLIGTSVGLTAGAVVGAGNIVNKAHAAQKKSAIEKTRFPVKKLDKTAEEIYQCKKTLKRWQPRNNPYKKVSEEMGAPFITLQRENTFRNAKNSMIGYGVKVKDPETARLDLAFFVGAGTWDKMTVLVGMENKGPLSWNPLYVPEHLRGNPDPDPDPKDLTKKIKQMARFFGASRSGITRLNRKWIFDESILNRVSPGPPRTKKIVFKDVDKPSETKTELIIPDMVNNAIVLILAMNRPLMQMTPTTTLSNAAIFQAYGRMGMAVVALAEAIRALGYTAIPCKNDTGLSIPLAIDAGLGQLSRMGPIITPWYGPHVRICKVLTDMPLVPDKPIDFGVTEFCTTCGICAKECPSGAISLEKERTFEPSGPTGNPGALKWYIDGNRCIRWWVESGGGCARCIDTCPYTTRTMGDYYGPGRQRDPDLFWDMDITPFGIDYTKEI